MSQFSGYESNTHTNQYTYIYREKDVYNICLYIERERGVQYVPTN